MLTDSSATVPVRLNGEARTFPSGTSLSDIVRELSLPEDRLAIECNRVIVKRELWATTVVLDGYEIEIVQFVGGG